MLTLENNVELILTGADKFDSHTALRHANELASPEFNVNVLLSCENVATKRSRLG